LPGARSPDPPRFFLGPLPKLNPRNQRQNPQQRSGIEGQEPGTWRMNFTQPKTVGFHHDRDRKNNPYKVRKDMNPFHGNTLWGSVGRIISF